MRRLVYSSAYMKSDPCMQYYQRMSPEASVEAFELSGLNDETLAEMGYGGYTILGWYEAKPEYYGNLANDGLNEMMLISDGNRTFLGYIVHDRLYELEQQEIIDCLMDEEFDEDEVGP